MISSISRARGPRWMGAALATMQSLSACGGEVRFNRVRQGAQLSLINRELPECSGVRLHRTIPIHDLPGLQAAAASAQRGDIFEFTESFGAPAGFRWPEGGLHFSASCLTFRGSGKDDTKITLQGPFSEATIGCSPFLTFERGGITLSDLSFDDPSFGCTYAARGPNQASARIVFLNGHYLLDNASVPGLTANGNSIGTIADSSVNGHLELTGDASLRLFGSSAERFTGLDRSNATFYASVVSPALRSMMAFAPQSDTRDAALIARKYPLAAVELRDDAQISSCNPGPDEAGQYCERYGGLELLNLTGVRRSTQSPFNPPPDSPLRYYVMRSIQLIDHPADVVLAARINRDHPVLCVSSAPSGSCVSPWHPLLFYCGDTFSPFDGMMGLEGDEIRARFIADENGSGRVVLRNASPVPDVDAVDYYCDRSNENPPPHILDQVLCAPPQPREVRIPSNLWDPNNR